APGGEHQRAGEEPEDDHAPERDEPVRKEQEVVREPHGNLLTMSTRTSASSARSATAGTSRNGKRSSIVADCASKRVFSSLSRIWCIDCSRPFLSVATNASPPVVLAMRRRSSGFTGKCSRT